MRLFVLTLGYSRKSVRLLVFQSSVQTWAELHEKAFRRLGGCTRVVVLDNLREGVLKPDIYDPTINPVYADMLRHYEVVAMPCRVRDPDRKGKVESGVGHAQKTPLKGMRFESPQEAQTYLEHWEAHWADTRAVPSEPPTHNDLLLRVEPHRILPVRVQIAEEGILPAGEREKCHRRGNPDVHAHHPHFASRRVFARRLAAAGENRRSITEWRAIH